MRKLKIVFCMALMLCLSSISISTLANTNTENSTIENIQPRTDIKKWIYKVENGNLYKRLYNYSTARWETDWIFVASGVEEL